MTANEVMAGANLKNATKPDANAATVAATNSVNSNNQYKPLSVSLYVGDVPKNLENPESILYDLFCKIGKVSSIRVCRDLITKASLGYAYVNFENPADAEKAINALNYNEIVPGKEIRIMWAVRDPNTRKNGNCNIFLKNLDVKMTNRQLYELASKFGKVLSCKHAENSNGEKRGYGFIYYESPEVAAKALESLNGYKYNDKEIHAYIFLTRNEREKENEKTFKKIFIKNLKISITEEEIKKAVEKYGEILNIFVTSHPQFSTKFAIIDMATHEQAMKVIENLNNTNELTAEENIKLYVARLRPKADLSFKQTLYQYEGRNLYVKYLPDNITEAEIRDIFSPFGNIESICMQKDKDGIYRGFTFVCYESKEASTNAIANLHKKHFIRNKPIYVQFAQNKNIRTRVLETRRNIYIQNPQFQSQSQYNMYNIPSQFPRVMGFPGPINNIFGNNNPGNNANINGYPNGFIQNGMMPFQRPPYNNILEMNINNNNNNSNFGINSNNANMPPFMQPLPIRNINMAVNMQQQRQMYPNMNINPNMNYLNHNNSNSMINNNKNANILPNQAQMPNANAVVNKNKNAIRTVDANHLELQLENMPQQDRKNFLGERLFSQISPINPENAAKITGMLLEMDVNEILNVLYDSNLLNAKINEAINVLRAHDASR